MKPPLILISLLIHFSRGASDFDEKIELLKDIEIPDIDDFDIVHEKCDKEGGNGTYDKLKTSLDTIESCISDFVDVKVLKTEIENSKKTGALDEVFGKYCAKRFKLATCLGDFVNNLRSCLTSDEKTALNLTTNILTQLGEFVCYKDGDRLAMFVAEGGTECFKARAKGIQSCVNATLKIIPSSFSTNPLPNLLIDRKKCDDLGKLQDCMVEELEKCSDTTPANIIDALFRFIKRSACPKKNKRSPSFHRILRRNIPPATYSADRIAALLQNKCSQNAPHDMKRIRESFTHARICIQIVNDHEENLLTIFSLKELKENFKECSDDFVETAELCFGDDEKYFPKFVQQIYFNLLEVAYKHKDLILNKTAMEKYNDCVKILREPGNAAALYHCIFQGPVSKIWTKEVVCENLMNGTACAIDEVKKKCSSDIFDDFVDDFVHFWKSSCKPNQN